MKYKWAVLLCMVPAMTVFMIDATIVNVALAKLSTVFGVDVATVGWTVSAFSLAMGISTPMASFIEKRFTMKRVWVTALILFTGGSLLCGVAPAFWVLIVGRLLQGAGGGVLFPMALSELFRVFPPNERGAAMGLIAIPMVAGPAFGPTIGGYIVTYLDWRMVFFVNLPIGILAVTAAILLLHPSTPQPDTRLDVPGAVLSSLAFGCTLYGLSRVSQDGWGSMTVRLFAGTGLVSLVIFCLYEATRHEPLLHVRLFMLPQFLIANIVGWVGTVALFGAEFMLPLYLQNLRGLTALDAGLMLMPQGLAVAIAGPIGGRLMDKLGARYLAMIGFALLAFNTWDMSHITLDTSFETIRWLLIVRGIALGFAMQPSQLVAIGAAPEHLRTSATSLNMAMRSVFQSLGVAMLATMVQTQTAIHSTLLSWQVRPDTLQGATLNKISALLQLYDGLSASTAHVVGVEVIVGQIARQAAVLAFGDAYRVTFFTALLAILLASLLPGRGAVKVDPTAVMEG